MKSRIFIYIVTLMAIASCSRQPDIERILSNTKFSLSSYDIIESREDWGIGESIERYELKILESDYKVIVDKIINDENFQKLNSNRTPIYAFDEKTDTQLKSEVACWYDSKYFYQVFFPKPASVITIELKQDSLMSLIYEDL